MVKLIPRKCQEKGSQPLSLNSSRPQVLFSDLKQTPIAITQLWESQPWQSRVEFVQAAPFACPIHGTRCPAAGCMS